MLHDPNVENLSTCLWTLLLLNPITVCILTKCKVIYRTHLLSTQSQKLSKLIALYYGYIGWQIKYHASEKVTNKNDQALLSNYMHRYICPVVICRALPTWKAATGSPANVAILCCTPPPSLLGPMLDHWWFAIISDNVNTASQICPLYNQLLRCLTLAWFSTYCFDVLLCRRCTLNLSRYSDTFLLRSSLPHFSVLADVGFGLNMNDYCTLFIHTNDTFRRVSYNMI